MIQKISVNNYQSHKQTHLELSDGVNIIVGSTDSGKSALLKALYWLIYNRPSGIAHASSWIKEDGELKGSSSVTIGLDDGYITRERNTNENLYLVNTENNEKLFSTIGKDVPEEVTQALNITDVNIQRQMDSPFLLSESAGEVARFFNKIVRLDKIDSTLSKINSLKRENNTDIKWLTEEIEKQEKELKNYNWIERASRLVDKYEKAEKELNEIEEEEDKLSRDIALHNTKKMEISEIEIWLETEGIILEIEINLEWIEKLDNEKCELEDDIEDHEHCTKVLDETDDIERADRLLKEIENIIDEKQNTQNEMNIFSASVSSYERQNKIYTDTNREVTKLEKDLPAVCPTCGSRLKGD